MTLNDSAEPGEVEPAPGMGRIPGVLLVIIIIFGALARSWNLNWDGGTYNLHPDEWALNEVVRTLGPDLHPHFFFYGSFPIYLYRATAEVLGILTGMDWLAQERLALIGRTYSALAGTAILPLVFAIGRQLWGNLAGLIAASCAAGAALLIQAAHFGTVDTLVTLVGVAIFWISLRIAISGAARFYVLAGIVAGLGIATKLTAVSFLLFPLLAHFGRVRRSGPFLPPMQMDQTLRLPFLVLAVALGTTLLTSPYYLLAWNELWATVSVQSAELNGGYKLPYTWQFIGSTPYLFELRNLVLWGLGFPLGLAALVGWGWALMQIVRQRTIFMLLLTSWPTIYLLYIGTWEARFIRHTLPLVPYCCLFAAGGLISLMEWLQRMGKGGRRLAGVVAMGVVAGAIVWGLAYLSIYTSLDSRLAATDWMHSNLEPGTRLVVEDQNQLLPLPSSNYPLDTYSYSVLRTTSPDTREKMGDFAAVLASGDVLILANRRWSSVLPRHLDFPLTGRYYRLLFEGELGYEPLATFASPPQLGPLAWSDDDAEETFQVFDHPTVRLFRNTGRLSEEELRRLLAFVQR